MNEEEKELINNIERALNLSEVKGDLVTIIYNYIVKATINLINKLQDKVDRQDKVINLMAEKLVEDSDVFNYQHSMTEEKWKEYFYKEVEKENK